MVREGHEAHVKALKSPRNERSCLAAMAIEALPRLAPVLQVHVERNAVETRG